MSTFLVTGGAGFIGSNLVTALRDRGHQVRVLDDLSTGRQPNLPDDVDLTVGDIRSPADVDRAMAGCEYVLHQAALPSVAHSVQAPDETHDVNVNGTLAVLQAARRAGVRRVVFAGSSAVYGDSAVLPKVETMPVAPQSPYALQKVTGEAYGRLWTRLYGLQVVTLRYFNVFGPRQSPASDYAAVIPRFVTCMLRGEAPTVFGDGLQTRDFCHIDNVVDANLLACSAPDAAGEVYNIACGERISLLDLIARINAILGTTIQPQLAPDRPGDIRHSVADISAARQGLGFEPTVDLAEGLRRTVAWYRTQGVG